MTRDREKAQKAEELRSIFMRLDDNGRDSAPTILRTLDFAQSVMHAEAGPANQGSGCQQTAGIA